VANHRNDISKAQPETALGIAERWQAEGGEHLGWLLRHGLRALVNRGDSRALQRLGADTDGMLSVHDLALASDHLVLGAPHHHAALLRRSPPARDPGNRAGPGRGTVRIGRASRFCGEGLACRP